MPDPHHCLILLARKAISIYMPGSMMTTGLAEIEAQSNTTAQHHTDKDEHAAESQNRCVGATARAGRAHAPTCPYLQPSIRMTKGGSQSARFH